MYYSTWAHVVRNSIKVKFRVGRVQDGHEELRMLAVVDMYG